MKLILYPDPILSQRSEEVLESELDYIKSVKTEMITLMERYSGIGLAAVQAGVLKRFAFIDMTRDPYYDLNTPAILTLINPSIIKTENEVRVNEGCLSLPWYQEMQDRWGTITVKYRDEQWNEVEKEFNGILSQCVQHEIEHFEGELLIDSASIMKVQVYKKKLKKKGLL